MKKGLLVSFLVVFAHLLFACPALTEVPETQAMQALRTGTAVLFMRHATAPGFGDPPGFVLDDCRTQRNLSEDGREQARLVGSFLRRQGIETALVYSSQWCRCLETARLLGFGAVRELPALNSFFAEPQRGPEQTRQLELFFQETVPGRPIILVTHQVNITAVTGVYPASGEMIVYRPAPGGGGTVLGRFVP